MIRVSMFKKVIIRVIAMGLLFVNCSSNAQQLTQYTARNVQKANELAQVEQLGEAIKLLEKLDSSRAYDKAFVSRMLGVFYWQNGEAEQAITNIALAVESGLLHDEQAWVTEKMLADLYVNSRQFSKANQHYYKLVEFVPENQDVSEIWFRLALSHYQQSEWPKTLESLGMYQSFAGEMSTQPLSLKLGALLQQKQWEPAIPTLEALIELDPNEEKWWRQMVSLQLKLHRTDQALATLSLAKLKGIELLDSDKRLLAQLYAQRGIPERAAIEISQLTGADTDVKLLVEQATYWQYAKEWNKAVDIWLLAAKQDNQYSWNAAVLLSQQGEYAEALVQLDRVSHNISPERATEIALAKARAYYKLGQMDNALVEAKHASNVANSKSTREQAESWRKYLNHLMTNDV